MSSHPDSPYARDGGYVGAGLSLVDERFRAFEDVPHDADEVEPGVNLRAGYRWHPRFAAELMLAHYAAFDVEISNARDGEVRGRALLAQVKGYFSTSRYQPYVSFGLGRAETDNTSGVGAQGGDPAIAAGVGADYYIAEDTALYVEAVYVHPTGDTDEFDFLPLTVGLSYRF